MDPIDTDSSHSIPLSKVEGGSGCGRSEAASIPRSTDRPWGLFEHVPRGRAYTICGDFEGYCGAFVAVGDIMSSMIRVFTASDPFEAYFVRDHLTAAGFEVTVRGEHLFAIRGGVPLTEDTLPSVWLTYEEDLPAAKELLARLEARRHLESV